MRRFIHMFKSILNIFNRKPDLVSIGEFISSKSIFSLHFSEGWYFDKRSRGGIYDFHNPGLKGAFQISGYQTSNPDYEYSINGEFEKTKKKYTSEIVDLLNTKAIMYEINYGNQKQYCWIIGNKNKSAFITYTTNELQSDKLDYEFNEVIKQLNTIRII